LLSQIPVIYASFSIDGTGSVNDYIRHGSDYTVIVENLRRWSEFKIQKGMKSITTVVQAYNLHDLKNIKSLAKQYNMFWTAQHIENPKEFQINALPPDYINSIKDEINTKFMSNYCYDVRLFKKLKTTTFEQDRLLGTDLSKVIPSLYNRINI
jgi:sulfatase maturation enzyme AslB (radical SAM superfamily)